MKMFDDQHRHCSHVILSEAKNLRGGGGRARLGREGRPCHSERSEESAWRANGVPAPEILRFAQNDMQIQVIADCDPTESPEILRFAQNDMAERVM